MKKKRTKVYFALCRRIIALLLAIWLTAMVVLTWAVAVDFQRQLIDAADSYAQSMGDRNWFQNENDELPGKMEMGMLRWLGEAYPFIHIEPLLPFVLEQRPDVMSGSDWYWGLWDLVYGYEFAEAYRDQDGQILISTGSYLSFTYTDPAHWQEQSLTPLGYSYVDLDALEGGRETFEHWISSFPGGDFESNYFLPVMRLTGRFEGNRFLPNTVERGTYFLTEYIHDPEKLAYQDSRGKLEWETLLTAPEEGDTVIYCWDVAGFDPMRIPLISNGDSFDSLADLMRTQLEGEKDYTSDSLLGTFFIKTVRQEDRWGKYSYTIALRCQPLNYAVARLWPCYLVSFFGLALAGWLLLRRIRNQVIRPLRSLYEAVDYGLRIEPGAQWREIRSLEEHFASSRQEQAESKTRIVQLETALDYAKNAEENRRQLVSNITHELKTPLAVIHSYAEGLQAGIAGEKREQYLTTILEETERMDAMVLQMLDLSRLEAGKVRLTMTQFSLLELTRAVAEKLKPMLDAKGLELNYDFAEDFLLTADEGRMEQVVTNLMTNALKYSPPGGRIGIKVYNHKRTARFYIENQSPHLSPEALEKVFDSFYRADPSRTEPGTGLGLTLVKSIVELHRGQCSVKNITYHSDGVGKTGIEFGFSLPME